MARIAPGPTGPALVRALRAMLRDPLPVLDELHGRYGDVVELRGPGIRLVLLAHPADVEQLLVGHARATSKGATLERIAIGMGRNLFTLEGEAHDSRRQLLTPLFRPRDVAPHAPHAIEHAQRTCGAWTSGEPVDMGAAMDRLVLGAMSQVLVGRADLDEAATLERLVHEAVALTPRLLDPAYPLRARFQPGHARPIRSLVARWDALCDELVERARVEHGGDPGVSDSVLHRLLAGHDRSAAMLDDRAALREELRGLLLSAHETTALALAWTLHELAHAPQVAAQVQREVDEVVGTGDVQPPYASQLPLVHACFDESLRLRGGTFVPRGALQDLRLDHAGVTVPRGYELLASMWTVHRDPRFWDEPTTYRPERFLEPDPDRPRFAWFPFGGGRRTCIGMHLATQTGVLALAAILRDWSIAPRPGDPPVGPVSNVLVRPQRPIELVPTARTHAG